MRVLTQVHAFIDGNVTTLGYPSAREAWKGAYHLYRLSRRPEQTELHCIRSVGVSVTRAPRDYSIYLVEDIAA